MALPKVKFEATEARLAGRDLPVAGGWTHAARSDALARLRAQGLPHRRDEYWRFTNPAALLAPEPGRAEPIDISDEAPLFAEIDRLELVFVDGVFDPRASGDMTAEDGIEISLLGQTGDADIHWARGLYGTLEARGQNPVARPFAALNTALATDGLLIRATGKARRPVSIVYRHENATSDAVLHHCIRVEPGAELTLLETGPAGARFDIVTEVDVADTGSFHHVRNQGRNHHRQAVTHGFARLGADTSYKSFTLTANGALTRNEHVLELAGDRGAAHVAGAAIGDAADDPFHHDDTVFITHAAEECESRQVFKKVLKNGAVGVFQGKILVHEGAQKTDGYQMSQSLLLDEDSQFLAKPELEIYADDVACSHGSTTGAIDETALFYLRSRGVPRRQAEDLLVLSFLAETLEEIADTGLREELLERLRAWLARRAG